jgi:hypothetical protein
VADHHRRLDNRVQGLAEPFPDGLPLVGEEVGVGVGNQLLQQLSLQQAAQRGWQRQDGRRALLHGRGAG